MATNFGTIMEIGRRYLVHYYLMRCGSTASSISVARPAICCATTVFGPVIRNFESTRLIFGI